MDTLLSVMDDGSAHTVFKTVDPRASVVVIADMNSQLETVVDESDTDIELELVKDVEGVTEPDTMLLGAFVVDSAHAVVKKLDP